MRAGRITAAALLAWPVLALSAPAALADSGTTSSGFGGAPSPLAPSTTPAATPAETAGAADPADPADPAGTADTPGGPVRTGLGSAVSGSNSIQIVAGVALAGAAGVYVARRRAGCR